MSNQINEDPRIDPRIKAVLGAFPDRPPLGSVQSRDDLLAEAASEAAQAMRQMMTAFMDAADSEEVAPSEGLTVSEYAVASEPDGNKINIRFIRPEGSETLPCVYYIHGGGMAAMSCYDGNYRAWGRIIAAQGVAVAMVDFRNSVVASSAE
ncbi:MAG: alpha/beta hydrolase family protein, partial [Acidimicrobiales bacterium]